MSRIGLQPYRFVSEKDGQREDRTFYAESSQRATALAQRWGKRTGHKMYRPKAKRGI